MRASMAETCRQLLVLVLCQFLLLQPVFARQAGEQPGIRIVNVRGDRAKNVIQQIPPEPLAVRVEDLNRRPVTGATVTFTAPGEGPSGEFANGSTTITITTGPGGLATADGYHPNAMPGSYRIVLRAVYEGQFASAAIEQTNVESGKSHTKLIVAIVSLAAVAAGAALLARHSSGGGDLTPTLTLGDSAVGAPKR